MYENWAVSFNWEKQFYSEFYNSTTKQNKLSWGFNAAFFTTAFWVVQKKIVLYSSLFSLRRNSLTQHKLLLPKCREMELPVKSTKKRFFSATLKDIY